MPKNENLMCPICGGVIWGGGQKVLIEGAKIRVCESCAQHGKKVIPKAKKGNYTRRSPSPTRKQSQSKSYKSSRSYLEPEVVIVEDFSKRIRNAREKRNMTQEKFAQRIHEKESLIRRIEAGKTKPKIDLAKKLENEYNINLLEDSDIIQVNTDEYIKKKHTGSSLGDIAFIKKKKKD
ncbi:MAG: multiprotein bridging factor aMBF1 [Promethearchaeati archaeon]